MTSNRKRAYRQQIPEERTGQVKDLDPIARHDAPAPIAADLDSRAEWRSLAAIVGHELNNIAVPLQGFTDLARLDKPSGAAMQNYRAEMRIGIDRIKKLASALEGLAELDANTSNIRITECVPKGPWTVNWSCDPFIVVRADPTHAQRAVEALAHIAGWSALHGAPIVFIVGNGAPTAARCLSCGSTLATASSHIVIAVRGPQLPNLKAISNPFEASGDRSIRRLTLAALVHGAHRAGAHILYDKAASTLGVAFPSL